MEGGPCRCNESEASQSIYDPLSLHPSRVLGAHLCRPMFSKASGDIPGSYKWREPTSWRQGTSLGPWEPWEQGPWGPWSRAKASRGLSYSCDMELACPATGTPDRFMCARQEHPQPPFLGHGGHDPFCHASKIVGAWRGRS